MAPERRFPSPSHLGTTASLVVALVTTQANADDQTAPILEGKKPQNVAVAPGEATVPASGSPAGQSAPSGGFPWSSVGWVSAGLGVVGLGLGTAYAFMVGSDKYAARCNPAGYCDRAMLDSAHGHAVAATVSWIAGGVFLAGGIGLLLFAPAEGARGTTRAVLTGGSITGARLETVW